jgi:hypothetical protein
MMLSSVDLPEPGRAEHDHQFAGVERQVDAAQGVDGDLAHLVDLGQTNGFE